MLGANAQHGNMVIILTIAGKRCVRVFVRGNNPCLDLVNNVQCISLWTVVALISYAYRVC